MRATSLWSDGTATGGRLARERGNLRRIEAVERLKDWTRRRFTLGDHDTILVAENARTLPGFPPLQTSIAFWTADGTRHHFTVFKPLEDVALGDFPPAWLKESLALSEGTECECC